QDAPAAAAEIAAATVAATAADIAAATESASTTDTAAGTDAAAPSSYEEEEHPFCGPLQTQLRIQEAQEADTDLTGLMTDDKTAGQQGGLDIEIGDEAGPQAGAAGSRYPSSAQPLNSAPIKKAGLLSRLLRT
ncbi:MAG: hypothetical protein Q3990_03465, partial [Desulfovibrionaceae bacterium]|nr:hypothetical protein [Desulfovibrionaceae bacterium]